MIQQILLISFSLVCMLIILGMNNKHLSIINSIIGLDQFEDNLPTSCKYNSIFNMFAIPIGVVFVVKACNNEYEYALCYYICIAIFTIFSLIKRHQLKSDDITIVKDTVHDTDDLNNIVCYKFKIKGVYAGQFDEDFEFETEDEVKQYIADAVRRNQKRIEDQTQYETKRAEIIERVRESPSSKSYKLDDFKLTNTNDDLVNNINSKLR